MLLCIHIVDIVTLGLHVLTLCVSEGVLSELLCGHIVDMGTFELHGLTLCVSEGPSPLLSTSKLIMMHQIIISVSNRYLT